MSREIKFRAWDKKTKKMREVESIGFGAISYLKEGYPVCNMIGRNCIEQQDMIIHRDSPDFELQQFTGLTDKNGVEIYEGDIVYIGGYGLYDCEFPFLELYDAVMENDIGEIKGNIHENPELLKELEK